MCCFEKYYEMNHFFIKADSVQDTSSREVGPLVVLRTREDFTHLAFPIRKNFLLQALYRQEGQYCLCSFTYNYSQYQVGSPNFIKLDASSSCPRNRSFFVSNLINLRNNSILGFSVSFPLSGKVKVNFI